MAGPITGIDDAENPPPIKRRKIRRGTQSCWECKRRKIRCTFVTPKESVCDGCRSRKVKCIGQQFGDAAVERHSKTDDRGRAETVAERVPTLNGGDLVNSEIRVGEDAKQQTAVSISCCQDI